MVPYCLLPDWEYLVISDFWKKKPADLRIKTRSLMKMTFKWDVTVIQVVESENNHDIAASECIELPDRYCEGVFKFKWIKLRISMCTWTLYPKSKG